MVLDVFGDLMLPVCVAFQPNLHINWLMLVSCGWGFGGLAEYK